MTSVQDLNVSSAKIATFKCRVVLASLEHYEYKARATGDTRKGMSFRCLLVSENPSVYVPGLCKGAESKVREAFAKFKINRRGPCDVQISCLRTLHMSLRPSN